MAHIHSNPMRQKPPSPLSHSDLDNEQSMPQASFLDSGPEIKEPVDPDHDGIYDGDFFA